MAATAEKARFFLEQSIPELREFERKNIFSKDEISNIIKKRSDFEHKLNARGAKSTDFARYAEFEMNLETLRKKRTKRLGIKAGQHNGNRRVFQVLDRATKKFHGDLGLWMQYLSVCRQSKAYNKINEVLSNIIRMHPTKPEVWIYAASYAMEEQGDMIEARSYMQRGLRFCRDSEDMWLTYARLELLYISKIHVRQEVLGLNAKPQEKPVIGEEDDDADMIALPNLTANDLNGNTNGEQIGESEVKSLSLTPALSGAIPLAVFDAAMKHFSMPEFGNRFFNMALDFRSLPCLPKISGHIAEMLRIEHPASPFTLDIFIRQPVAHIDPTSVEYPQALAVAFTRLRQTLADYPSAELFNKVLTWLVESLSGGLQEDIEQALLAMLLRVIKLGQASNNLDVGDVIHILEHGSAPNPNVLSVCFDVWPDDSDLKNFATSKIGKEAVALVRA